MKCSRTVDPKLVIDASTLRNRLTIERVSRAADGGGGATETWATFATVWASIEPVSGQWQFTDGKPMTPVLFKVRMRYLAGIQSNDRIAFDGRLFQITSIKNITERNVVLEIMCQEQDSNG